MEISKSLGQKIINLRKSNNVSREDLANELGIPYTTLRNYENGLREPGHLFLIKVAKRFNVTTDYLLDIQNSSLNISSENDVQKQKLIQNYEMLNDAGKNKLVEYSEDLKVNPKYTEKVHKIKIAARNGRFEERTVTDSDIEKLKNLADMDDDI